MKEMIEALNGLRTGPVDLGQNYEKRWQDVIIASRRDGVVIGVYGDLDDANLFLRERVTGIENDDANAVTKITGTVKVLSDTKADFRIEVRYVAAPSCNAFRFILKKAVSTTLHIVK